MEELVQKVDTLTTKLAQSFYSTTQMLNTLIMHTERYYEGSHSRYISEKAEAVAMELGLPRREVMETKIASLLHDIGKVGFPDTTLFKHPAEMTGNEQKLYLMHPELGYNILIENSDFRRIASIVYQHHERLDGTGFPRHLKAPDILDGAKIIGVIDYFHNAVYKLPRKQATAASNSNYSSTSVYLSSTHQKYKSAIEYLRKKSDQLYDKNVVDSFIHVIENERKHIGEKQVVRVAYTHIEPGMILAEDYRTKYGMLIAARGETVSKDMIKSLARFVNAGDLPNKILVMR